MVDVLLNEPEGPSGKLTTTCAAAVRLFSSSYAAAPPAAVKAMGRAAVAGYKPEQLGDYMSYDMTGSLGPKGKTYKYLTSTPYYRFGYAFENSFVPLVT